MDVMKKFKLEYAGIKGNINKYTSDDYIANILNKLDESAKSEDETTIIYLLEMLNEWYKENQGEIQSNAFVSNKEQHLKNQSRLVEFYKQFKNDNSETPNTVIEERNIMKKIFISHSSKDEIICTAFVNLLEALGVPEGDILYSSSDRHGVPGDTDIFSYLKEHIKQGISVFYMLSDNYYESPYCLNEMGAAWVVQNDFSIFFLPNFTVGIQGVIDGRKKGFSLDSPGDLIQIKNKILSIYNSSISELKWEEVKNKFLSVVKSKSIK